MRDRVGLGRNGLGPDGQLARYTASRKGRGRKLLRHGQLLLPRSGRLLQRHAAFHLPTGQGNERDARRLLCHGQLLLPQRGSVLRGGGRRLLRALATVL